MNLRHSQWLILHENSWTKSSRSKPLFIWSSFVYSFRSELHSTILVFIVGLSSQLPFHSCKIRSCYRAKYRPGNSMFTWTEICKNNFFFPSCVHFLGQGAPREFNKICTCFLDSNDHITRCLNFYLICTFIVTHYFINNNKKKLGILFHISHLQRSQY